MKRNQHIFILLLIAGMLTSCEKSDIEYENNFDKSYKSWISFKEKSGNTYHYMVSGSTWTGSAWQTNITIADGKITQRHFKYTSVKGLVNIPQEAVEWTEGENEINSHENTSAAYPLTLDQIYDKAKTDWLLKRTDAEIYFETKNNGMISSCGYVENNCAEDCFNGIRIGYIEEL